MKFEELSAADQQLLNTDLGDFEKDASEKMALADEMYAHGYEKLATETADHLDAMRAFEKEASENEIVMDEGSEKQAQDFGAFIERGFFDGLCKLGSERHGDEMIYLYPFIEEKIAGKVSANAVDKVRKFISSKADAVKGRAREGAEWAKSKAQAGMKAESNYRHGAMEQAKGGGKGLKAAVTGTSSTGRQMTTGQRVNKAKGSLKALGTGVAKLSPYAAVPAGAAYGAKKLYDKSKKSESSEG